MAYGLLRIALICGILIALLWNFVPGSAYTGTALIVFVGLLWALVRRRALRRQLSATAK